jgi:DNA-binding NtrC family response regulator
MTVANISLKEARILIVDDQPTNLDVLSRSLSEEGFEILAASNGEDAISIAERAQPELILLDVMMPDMDGFQTCERLKSRDETRDIPVIFITAKDDTQSVLTGFERGGVDYVVKPFRSEEVLARVISQIKIGRLMRQLSSANDELTKKNDALQSEIAEREALTSERSQLASRLSLVSAEESERWGIDGFVGQSKLLEDVLRDIHQLQHAATTSVLITGESGTGKELIARAIHAVGAESDSPFLPVNCSAIPDELADALFFGHRKGTFTGAEGDRAGYFELADGGTLFLDEVGDMPLDLQAKLLRVLEDGRILPIGAAKEREVTLRVVAATNVDLQQHIAAGRFRQDLYFRLARFPVSAPPLRDRKEDIPLLARHFVQLFAREMGVEPTPLNEAVLRRLEAYPFPGNVRELKNIIERALIMSGGRTIEPQHIQIVASPAVEPPVMTSQISADDLPLNFQQAELILIHRAMEAAAGNITEAAKLLGIHRSKIYRKLAEAQELVS